MKHRVFSAWKVLAAVGLAGLLGFAYATESTPTVTVSPPVERTFPPRSPGIVPTPEASGPLTDAQRKSLIKQFSKALDNEYSALKHRQKTELKELKSAHKAQLKEWDSKEVEARHKFFAEHKTGPERRAYVQEYLRRRDLMTKIQSDEEDRRSQEQSVRLDSLKQDQDQKQKEFEEIVKRGERPSARFWPN